MAKFMDGLYKYFTWIIILLSLVAYFAFMILEIDGDIKTIVADWQTWVHTAFVIFLNVMTVSGAYDSGTVVGVSSKEFMLADQLNNKIVTSVNNEMKPFRNFVKDLNDHELQLLRDDFLFKIGDKKVSELTKDELKKFKELKPIKHDIYGFNLPLYYEMSKNGQVSYKASVKKNQGKLWKQIKKIFTGGLFAAMTINVTVSLGNFGAAFTALLIIACGLITTYLLTFFPQVFKFKNELPKKVILKKTLYDSFVEYKTGTHNLKKLELVETTDYKETTVEKAIKKDEQINIHSEKNNLLTEGLEVEPAPLFNLINNMAQPKKV